ncbi:MAG: YqaJ viral recombinase family protein [Marinilabiliaceae bacterium]|nr:YqaJ viral recombinase family protein [Marinilabiliaceae bacterium]
MTKTRLTFHNRAEWLAARTQGIGASEVSSILGLNPFETPYMLWRRKMGLETPKQETIAMRDGHFLEGAVADYFGSVTNSQILKNSAEDFIIMNNERKYLRVSPDRLYWSVDSKHSEADKCVLECKSTNKNIDEANLPKHWFVQLQMNLGVGEYKRGALAWFCKLNGTFNHVNVDFAPDFYGWLVEEVEKFWVDNILGKKEPDSMSVEDVIVRYQKCTNGKAIEATPEILAAMTKLKEVRADIAKLEADGKACEDAIKIFLSDADTLTNQGVTLATWRNSTSSRLDTKAFKADYPDLYAKYAKETDSRRFLIK